MTQPEGASATERLDELAAVTKEYAEAARGAYGVAAVVGGVIALSVLAVDVFTGWQWTWVLFATFPAAWLVAIHVARARYLRHGHVAALGTASGPSRFAQVWVTFMTALVAAGLGLRVIALAVTDAVGMSALVSVSVVVAIATASTPVLFSRVAVPRKDTLTTFGLIVFVPGMISQSPAGFPSAAYPALANAQLLFHWLFAVIAALLAVVSIVSGLREHRSYRRLERRLAALRSAAA
jgi:hypothetical protein